MADESIRDQVTEKCLSLESITKKTIGKRKGPDLKRSSNDCKSHGSQRQTGRHYGKLKSSKTWAECDPR